jgi:hypothetical protein
MADNKSKKKIELQIANKYKIQKVLFRKGIPVEVDSNLADKLLKITYSEKIDGKLVTYPVFKEVK